ncbi:YrvL family regulatory protein [Niallia taxi]|uniref:YrvL family regulatory protein n=1 Tax=Niallia taxi TaxID=2499688 RepID=UPI003D2E0C38
MGVQYDSFGSLLWFIGGYLLIGGIGELFTNVMRIFMRKAQKWRESQIKAVFILSSFLVNLIIISFLDNVMN